MKDPREEEVVGISPTFKNLCRRRSVSNRITQVDGVVYVSRSQSETEIASNSL